MASAISEQYAVAVSEIVGKARRAAGLTRLSDEELVKTAQAFAELVELIPEDRLYDCYLRAMRERTGNGRFALQPQELIAAWQAIKGQFTSTKTPEQQTDDESCDDCIGTGYQTLRSSDGYTGARPCACPKGKSLAPGFHALPDPGGGPVFRSPVKAAYTHILIRGKWITLAEWAESKR